MDFFHLLSVLIVLSAGFAYINFRFFKLPSSIGLMIISLLFSISMIAGGTFFLPFKNMVSAHLSSINFSELLLEVLLSFMLFAGAIHLKYKDLISESLSIILFATISVVISTVIIGYSSYFLLGIFGIKVQLIHAMLFGSLLSPTDPIAVLSIIKKSGISKSLETKIAGESLFNDGVAVVIFITILQLAKPEANLDIQNVTIFFLTEAFGGLLLGIIIGYLGYKLVASIDNYQVEVLITLAIVMGGYTLAHFIHVSGPLAMVAAGLITGNHGKSLGMSELTKEYIDKFWELIDEILNALLFVLIGLELILVQTNSMVLIVAFLLIFVVLIARFISILIPSIIIRLKEKVSYGTIKILTWGGLRGGISIALALSIPPSFQKDIWTTLTYVIVCFSIIVQGLTIGALSKKQI